jgi:hypothetical protein
MRFNSYRRRDLSITELPGGYALVVACDSSGSIGEKASDKLVVSAAIAGAFIARVALLEVMAIGAEVVGVMDAVSCEMEPTGRHVIAGIHSEMVLAGVPGDLLNGSTEENFETSMTAIGVSVIGLARLPELKIQPTKPGDKLVLYGVPLVGLDVLREGANMVKYDDVRALLRDNSVREMVPVGSGGILREANILAGLNGLEFIPGKCAVNMLASAGPASCLIAAVDPQRTPDGRSVEIGYFA